MVSLNDKMEAPSPLNGNPRSHKGPVAEGVALTIKSTKLKHNKNESGTHYFKFVEIFGFSNIPK